jgi:hypothetical protein
MNCLVRAPLNAKGIALAKVRNRRRPFTIQKNYPFRANINTIPTASAKPIINNKPLTVKSYGFYRTGLYAL